MKPLLRVVLVINALIFLASGLLFLLTPWARLYGALQLVSIRVQPAFAGQLLGIALIGLSWLAFHAAIDGALTARAARVSGHVQWLGGIVVLVWLLGLHMPDVDERSAVVVGAVLVVLGLGSVRLSSAVRRRERAKLAGTASAARAEKRAAKTREATRAEPAVAASSVPPPVDTPMRPSARAPEATAIDPVSGRAVDPAGRPLDGGAVDPVTGATFDPVTGRKLDPVTGREIDPVTGKRIDPVISGEIDPATGRRIDPLTGRVVPGAAPDAARGAPR
ncbi:hypothetical protein [Caballeronia ptereochthonis]|uniref:Transmembrane protein n=1 Tax=Caballeronia ptereochthonis TaxID=1777144 RepID=A0A158A945_9BURK|nr:hypothetical protein [Caballeronia ptereochthonis]SAK54116.1 hypothetical protein AWB83_01486 [Caballeronia ptereochthonis]